jgi:uncharacterized protein YecE (DUF72 family)
MNLYLGCPVWAYKGWMGSFYPKGTKSSDYLYEYARRLNTVEGNTTFYAVPAPNTLERWAAETPESFRFCPKLPRTVSHAGNLAEHIEEARQFFQAMSPLGPRLGPLFLQLPPRYPPTKFTDLQVFLESWPSKAPLAVEVRHTGWFDAPHEESLNALLSEHGAARVIIDTRPIRNLRDDPILGGSVYQRLLEARERKPNLPTRMDRTAAFTFIRYIGHPQFDRNELFLAEWVDVLAAWLKEGADAYVFCHCPDERLDPWLCRAIHQRVSALVPLPPLPWDETDSTVASQPSLF